MANMQLDEIKIKYGKGHIVVKSEGLDHEENAKAMLGLMSKLSGESQEPVVKDENIEPAADQGLWSKKQVCEYLGYGTSWVNKKMKAGVFVKPKIIGRNMKWRSDDVKDWVSHGKAA